MLLFSKCFLNLWPGPLASISLKSTTSTALKPKILETTANLIVLGALNIEPWPLTMNHWPLHGPLTEHRALIGASWGAEILLDSFLGMLTSILGRRRDEIQAALIGCCIGGWERKCKLETHSSGTRLKKKEDELQAAAGRSVSAPQLADGETARDRKYNGSATHP